MSRQLRRRKRLLIGGDVWKRDISRIKQHVSKANQACASILQIIEHYKSVPFSSAIAIYVTTIATSLTSILEAIDQIEAIGKDYREEQDQPGPVDEAEAIIDEAFEE